MENYKPKSLEVQNIKKIVDIKITPTSNVVQITGKNGSGKTSTLDSLWWVMDGESSIQTDPIRHGEQKAKIRLDLGEIIATRAFTRKGDTDFTTSLKVEAADGSRFTNPQSMLNELLGNLTFDPLNFTRVKPKEQLEMLKTFAPGVDFDAIDVANETDFDARTEINREHRSLVTQAEAIELPEIVPEEVDLQVLNDQLRDAEVHNRTIDARKEAHETTAQMIKRNTDQITAKAQAAQNLRHQAAALDEEITTLKAEAEEMQAKLDTAGALPEVIDTAIIYDKIYAAEAGNKLSELAIEKANLVMLANNRKSHSEELTKKIENRKAETEKAVKATKMPVDGMGFGDDCILFNGVPFNQASDAEQLQVSIMMAIAMNPRLKIIRVRDGSLLDDDAMELLNKIADEHDYSIWVERVDNSGKIGFVIEDGRLANTE